jgi:sarcosine reductase
VKLELATFSVRDVAMGAETKFADGVLTISAPELRALLLEEKLFRDVEIGVVRPGDSVRIIHLHDAVEPRFRVSAPGTDFPGLLSPPNSVGFGRTNRLAGISILEVAEPVPGEPTYWRQAIVDMSGEGAAYSPFSQLLNVVLTFYPNLDEFPPAPESLDNVWVGTPQTTEYHKAVRVAGLKAAVYLAKTTSGLKPDNIRELSLTGRNLQPNLPGVVYLFQAWSPYVYGELIPGAGGGGGPLPTVIHPNEVLDGAIVDAGNRTAFNRAVTYLVQNHAVIDELYEHHGKDLNFKGVILYTYGNSTETKERISAYAANLAVTLGADGAILNYIGAGHSIVDVMTTCAKLERRGVKTTLLLMEMAANPGESGFIHYVSEADAIVSTGNYEQRVSLDAPKRVLGGSSHLLESGEDSSGPLEVPLRYILASTGQFGASNLRGRSY